MSYNRARLLLGMTGVGLWVVLSAFFLWQTIHPGRLLILYLTLSLGLDLVGGQVLPRRFGQTTPSLSVWLMTYLRALALHTSVFVSAGCLLLWAGRFGFHLPVALGITAILVSLQIPLARWSGTQQVVDRFSFRGRVVELVDCDQPGFNGGVAGLPGRETIIVPAEWPEAVREVAWTRRAFILAKGARTAGLLVAAGFNLLGFYLATRHGLRTWSDLSQASLLMTLWSFLGLLVLPSFERAGVLWADSETRKQLGWPSFQIYLDSMTDETEEAKPVSEPVFYPIPSRTARVRNLQHPGRRLPLVPWFPARMALFLSVGSLSLISRAVHCNSGRPALWFFPPCD